MFRHQEIVGRRQTNDSGRINRRTGAHVKMSLPRHQRHLWQTRNTCLPIFGGSQSFDGTVPDTSTSRLLLALLSKMPVIRIEQHRVLADKLD